LDAAEENSREVERNRIRPHAQRLTLEYASRTLNRKEYSDNITRLDIRDLAEMEMQRLLSEPEELIGEFQKGERL
jgi:CYTH domain-containing protein